MKDTWRDRVSLTLAVLLVALAIVEILVPHPKPRFPWHHVPGYAGIIGLVGCILVVQLSKALGSWILQRPEASDD